MGGHTSYSHLTVAEINGGIDGLLMAEFSHEWQRTSGRLVALLAKRRSGGPNVKMNINLLFNFRGISIDRLLSLARSWV